MEVVALLSQGRTAAAQCGLFTHKSVPIIFEPPCKIYVYFSLIMRSCAPFFHEMLNYLPLPFLFMIQIFALSYISDVTDLTIWQAKQQLGPRNTAH